MDMNLAKHLFKDPVPEHLNTHFFQHFEKTLPTNIQHRCIYQYFFDSPCTITSVTEYEPSDLELAKEYLFGQYFIHNLAHRLDPYLHPATLVYYGFTDKDIPINRYQITPISITNTYQCHICLSDSVHDSLLTRLNCSHVFHTICLLEWILERKEVGCIFGCRLRK